MTMSDAELLEPPPVPPAVEQPVAEKTSEEVKSNNSAELKVMEEKLKKVEMDKARMATEIEKQKSEILNLRDSATKLTKDNADTQETENLKESQKTLEEKIKSHELELTQVRR